MQGATQMNSIQANISKVTVFRNGARITRTGEISADKGPVKVIIEGITEYAEKDSVRVTSSGPVMITSFDVRTRSILKKPKEDRESLVKELDNLRLKAKEIKGQIEIEQERQSRMIFASESFAGMFGVGFAAGESEISRVDELDSTTERLLIETADRIIALKKELKEIEDRIKIIEENVQEFESEIKVNEVHDVEVTLDVKEGAKISLEISYQVNGCRWNPSYDIEVSDKGTKLRRIAMIFNDTRESWNNVKLVVSTSSSNTVEAIEPTPFFIREYIPRPPRRIKAKRAKHAEEAPPSPAIPAVMTEVEYEPEPMEELFADVEESLGGIATYEIPKPVTIPDDGEEHPVTLIEEELNSKTLHYWYTDEMPDVVAYNQIENGSVVILPGPMKVFAGEEFIGETHIEMVSPRESFKAGVRTAYDVKAKKELIEKIVEKAGLTRGKMRRKYRYRLTVENFAREVISIEVNDRIPHSESEKISVKFDWQKHFKEKPKLGILKWQLEIQPSEKKIIEYEFEVEWERGVNFTVPLP